MPDFGRLSLVLLGIVAAKSELAAALECLTAKVRSVRLLQPHIEQKGALARLVGFSEHLLAWMKEAGLAT